MFSELTTLYTLVLATLFGCAVYLRHIDEHKNLVSKQQYRVLIELGVMALVPLGISVAISVQGVDHSYGVSFVLISMIPLWNICYALTLLSQNKKRHRSFTANKSWFWGLLMVSIAILVYQASKIFGYSIDASDVLLFFGCLMADLGMLALAAPVYHRSTSVETMYSYEGGNTTA